MLAFVADLQRDGVAAGTIRNIRDVLRLVLGLAVKSGALKANPVTDVEVPGALDGSLLLIFSAPRAVRTERRHEALLWSSLAVRSG